jgi:hypothetical protein
MYRKCSIVFTGVHAIIGIRSVAAGTLLNGVPGITNKVTMFDSIVGCVGVVQDALWCRSGTSTIILIYTNDVSFGDGSCSVKAKARTR